MPFLLIALISICSGVFYGLSFPPFSYSFLIWFSFIPFFFISNASRKEKCWASFLTGFIANTLIFYWIIPTFHVAGQPLGLAILCLMLLSCYLALYFLVLGLAQYQFRHSSFQPFIVAFVWVALEFVRSHLFSGLPWALTGHSQYKWTPLIQVASITGTEGVSFLILVFQSWFVNLFQRHSRDGGNSRFRHYVIGFHILFVPLLLLGSYYWGVWRLHQWTRFTPASTLKAVLLQGNIDQYQKWDLAYETMIKTKYEQLSVEAALLKPDVIVWPESAVPAWIPNDEKAFDWLAGVIEKTKTAHIVGAVSQDEINKRDFNSAFLLSPVGVIESQYNKQHLVPFGEYVPFESILKKWVPYLGQLGTFDSGHSPVVFNVEGHLLAPSLCYEIIFSPLIRTSVKKGAEVLVNLTNDGWYLTTGAPEQHFSANVLRAVEFGRPVIRSANTGISGYIDELGRVKLTTQLMETKALYIECPLRQQSLNTIYYRWGDWFVWGAFILCLILSLIYCRPCHEN